MEMPDSISNIFNEVMNYFSDTPLHDVPQNMKKETLSWLVLFSQWQEKQVNKFSEISSRCFPAVKTQFTAKDFNKFYMDVNSYMQSPEYKTSTQELSLKYKTVEHESAYQVLATMTLNIQKDILTEIDERIDKETVQLLDKISLDETLSASGRGKIRYIGGYVVAKLKYRNSKLLRNCLFAPGKDENVNVLRKKGEILDLMCSTYSDIVESTVDVDSLDETKRKQNKSESLCNITDSSFNVFIQLEVDCRRYLTYETLNEQRSGTCNYVENILQNDKKHQKNFIRSIVLVFCEEHGIVESETDFAQTDFCDSCKLCDILKPIFESMVSLFLKVTVAQFRRDFLSALKVEKSKALRKKVVERQKSKTKPLDMNFMQ